VPDLTEAHEMFADYFRARHAESEARGDAAGAAQYEALLRIHATPRHQPWLRGMGALTLLTDVPADVIAYRYAEEDRHLVPVPVGPLGRTPMIERELPSGSYVLELRADGCAPVRYPVRIGRLAHWDGVPPGASDPLPIRLPRLSELGPDEVYVPAGWSTVGGDPLAFGPLPARVLWVDAFVIGRFPVTEPAFFAFIQAVFDEGRQADARRWAPCHEPGLGGFLWAEAGGRFTIGGRDPRLPAHGVDWFGADAYARWMAAHTGLPWRLPGDVEWEKAARGVDGRFLPFGNHVDGQFCCFAGSHRGPPAVQPIDSFPLDESPYAVRGLGGNVGDWIQCRYERNGHPVVDGRIAPNLDADPAATRIQRGGAWPFHEQHARAATRWWQDPVFRHGAAGFRLARPF
jgi:formylglycine-generating enzyme required for sulfatase activity